ncbi:hypothetical protein F6455_00610 [Proteobacteria bacterium 005FR1]|nr:hypothetical protein [Proteobacteria bacterium 005FR1]
MSKKLWHSLAATLALSSFGAFAADQCYAPAEPVLAKPWGNLIPDVEEGFESATLDVPYTTGFSWGSARGRSIVRDDQYRVWKGESILEGPESGREWEGFSGSHAMLFSFPAGQNGFAEQRFSLGKAYPELWVGYWLRVPTNWTHGSGNTNNKFFAIWMDEYERVGPTGVIQTRNRNGDSAISPYVRTRDNDHLGERMGNLLIDISRDRGRWMQVAIHVKMASGASAADGVFELYRRWEGEQDFEKIFGYDDWDNYHVGGNRGFAHGYLMGWANATQPEASEWLLDDFVVTTENLLLVPSFTGDAAPQPRPAPAIPVIIGPQG